MGIIFFQLLLFFINRTILKFVGSEVRIILFSTLIFIISLMSFLSPKSNNHNDWGFDVLKRSKNVSFFGYSRQQWPNVAGTIISFVCNHPKLSEISHLQPAQHTSERKDSESVLGVKDSLPKGDSHVPRAVVLPFLPCVHGPFEWPLIFWAILLCCWWRQQFWWKSHANCIRTKEFVGVSVCLLSSAQT